MTDVLDRLQSALADRYTIDRELGRGGMAVVYLARDLKLGREVALKVLRSDLAASIGGERFLREIEIAARLTHPNILALYDCGEADGQLYYTMPVVEGESLRDRLNREKQLPIDDALQITKEVADALGHAHSIGIVHRDIKPENILFAAGHAVVSDFGIARAVTEAGAETLTETGLAIGTPTYMSPEQATGTKEIDARSDLYSLGCVLYEMLSGETPHLGNTPQSIVAKKLSEPAPRVSVVRDKVPFAVEEALDTVLSRTPADRFATAALFTDALYAPVPTVPLDARPARATRRWLGLGLGAAVVLTAIVVVLLKMIGSGPISITTSDAFKVTSDPGLEYQPAISPSGEEVAYVAGSMVNPRLFLRTTREVGVGPGLPIGEEVDGLHWFPRWASDGSSVTFLACLKEFTDCAWKEVGKLGGAGRTVEVPADHWAWSRGGTRVAFAVQDSIFASAAHGGEPELLGVHVERPQVLHSLAWSPDGRRVAYVNGNPGWRRSVNIGNASIWVLDASGGTPLRVTGDTTMSVSPQWLPDSRHLLFISDLEGQREVYAVEVGPTGPRGGPQKVAGPTDAHSISVSADGRRLTYAKFPAEQNVWAIPIPEEGHLSIRDAIPVTTGNQVIEQHDVSSDGEWIAFDTGISGEADIYKQRLAGGSQQLVADITGHAYAPAWSPDGTEIAYYGIGSGEVGSGAEVWVVPAEGGAPVRLSSGSPGAESDPDWSPDGLSVAYQSLGARGARGIWVVSRDSVGAPWGEPQQLTDIPCTQPDWAPDGRSLMCGTEGVSVRVSRNGEVLSRYDPSTDGLENVFEFAFSPDGSRIYFAARHESGAEGMWWIPTSGGDATQVVAFDDPRMLPFTYLTVSLENIYLTIAKHESDIWVMDLEW